MQGRAGTGLPLPPPSWPAAILACLAYYTSRSLQQLLHTEERDGWGRSASAKQHEGRPVLVAQRNLCTRRRCRRAASAAAAADAAAGQERRVQRQHPAAVLGGARGLQPQHAARWRRRGARAEMAQVSRLAGERRQWRHPAGGRNPSSHAPTGLPAHPSLTGVQHEVCAGPPGGRVDHSAPHRKAQRLAEETRGVQRLCRGDTREGRQCRCGGQGRECGTCRLRAPPSAAPRRRAPMRPPAPGASCKRRTEPPILKLARTQALRTTQPCQCGSGGARAGALGEASSAGAVLQAACPAC